mgnify:CR=1 FL=1
MELRRGLFVRITIGSLVLSALSFCLYMLLSLFGLYYISKVFEWMTAVGAITTPLLLIALLFKIGFDFVFKPWKDLYE